MVLVNFRFRGVLLIGIIVRQGPTTLAIDAGWAVLTFLLASIISLHSTSVVDIDMRASANLRQEEILYQRTIKPKTTNEPTQKSNCAHLHLHKSGTIKSVTQDVTS